MGVVAVALWIYINLAFKGTIKVSVRQVLLMRVAFGSWLVTLILSLHIYQLVWV